MTHSDGSAPEVLSQELIYKGALFEVVLSQLRLSPDHIVERAVVEHPGAVAIAAFDEQQRWLMVEQYRHPAKRRLLEVPAGTLEPGEDPGETAMRELREETGYRAASLERIGGSWMAPGFTSEYIHFYFATGLSHDPLPQDEDEDLSEPIPMTEQELGVAIDDGRIEDAKTVVAMTLVQRHRLRSGAH